MSRAGVASSLRVHWVAFFALLAVMVTLAGIYTANLVRWQNSPDFGWRHIVNTGPHVVSEVFDRGDAAGLRVGDRIAAINGRRYTTFHELFFGGIRSELPGSVNTYTIVRPSGPRDIRITTGTLGLHQVLSRSLPMFLLGLFYIGLGALIFLMKPHATESWLFLVLTCSIGVTTAYSTPADTIHPPRFYDARFVFQLLVPATLIHLALTFPKRRAILLKQRWLLTIPYALVLGVLVAAAMTGGSYWNLPKYLYDSWSIYTATGVVIFLISTVWNTFREESLVVRLQSRVILVGVALGLFIPAGDLIMRSLWQIRVFPDPAVGFAIFLTLFPLSIGYTIVKHDLFSIDTIVRRTYGYVLSTGTVVAVYAGLVSILNLSVRSSDVARSPAFSIGFALGVVLLFEPLHRRLQRLVDRTFYRQQYDYRTAIKSLTEAMTSILDAEKICQTLVSAVVKEMVLENGVLLLRNRATPVYEVAVVDGTSRAVLGRQELPATDAVITTVTATKSHVLRHDVSLDRQYADQREDIQRTLDAFASDLVLPMVYKDEVGGVLALGRKKSGKLFTPEDLDLLRTMLSQSAIALENARLFSDNLQKGRMEEELRIARDIQMGMLPEHPPHMPGVTIAARTVPAREVGGDFYDFIQLPSSTGQSLGILIADVSGKGVSAGLLMAASRSTYRVLLDTHPSVRDVMLLANERLRQDIQKGMFVALLYAVLDPDNHTLTLSNAGQTQPILCGPGGDPSYITTDGDTFPLGIVADSAYEATTVKLSEASTVIFYTDGIVEAMNAAGELYGFDRLVESIRAHGDRDVSALLQCLFDDVGAFVGTAEQHDDMTVIAARLA